MTLPPSTLPSDNASLAGDLLAVLGAPAASGPESQPAAPFAEMLASATPAAGPDIRAQDALFQPCPLPAAAPLPFYVAPVQSDAGEECSPTTEAPVEGNATDENSESTADGENIPTIAYEFIAGQWVQKPVTDEKPTSLQLECDADLESCPAKAAGYSGRTEPEPGPQFTQVVTDKKSEATAAETPKTKAPDPTSSAKEFAETMPAATPVHAETGKTESRPNPVRSNEQFNPLNSPAKVAAEGASLSSENQSGGNTSNRDTEKKLLSADGKVQGDSVRKVGTSAANREYSMPYTATNKAIAPATSALPQVSPTHGMQNITTPAPEGIHATPAAQAPRLVQEVRAIAERISNIDRNTVEVRFDFNEADRLSVRVEYRDGVVHTTFKTDSQSLRDVIAREWQVQAPSGENRAYRVAEPIFSTNSNASSVDLSGSGLGSGHSHARTFEQQEQAAWGARPGSVRTNFKTPAASAEAPASLARPETSSRLHAFA